MADADDAWPDTADFRHIAHSWTSPLASTADVLIVLHTALGPAAHSAVVLEPRRTDLTARDLRRYVARSTRPFPPFDSLELSLVGAGQLEDAQSLHALARAPQPLGIDLKAQVRCVCLGSR